MKKLILTLTILTLISCGSTEENKAEKEPLTRISFLTEQAKKETLANLKSPSTAVFIDSLTRVRQLPEAENENVLSNEYAVYLSVDAQNSYGANIRNRFTVVYVDQGKDSLSVDNYELKYFWD